MRSRFRLKQKQVDIRLRIVTVPEAQEEAQETACRWRSIMTSLVVTMSLLRVMMYVVFKKLFDN